MAMSAFPVRPAMPGRRVVSRLAALAVLVAAPPATLACLLLPGGAKAEVRAATPAHMTLVHEVHAPVPASVVWRALLAPRRWWSGDHTYSGSPANLTLDTRPGGCWCERWPDGQVEHARVLQAVPGTTLRLQGAFGPLQAMALNAVWTIELGEGAGPGTTRITATYVVNGTDASGLDRLAPVVDQVMGGQIARLAAAGR
jgi:uncharacterized protein YndB with AHSA1/START domain